MKRIISIAAAGPALAVGIGLATIGGPSAAASSAPASGLPKLTIAMSGHSIDVGGTLQSGAVDVVSTTTNEPAGAPLLVRLNAGVTPAQLYAFLGTGGARDPNNLSRYGSIVFSASAPTGTSHVQTKLEPAQYVAFDSAGRDPSKWPTTTFSIANASSPAALPSVGAKVRAIDFAFRGARTLHQGESVRFVNGGFLVHMIVGTEAKSAKAAKPIVKALRAGNDAKAKRLSVGGALFMGVVSPGAVQQMKVTAKPGVWVLACFMQTQDRREHTRLGMERIIHITG
jgi:hypothetical protein